MEKKNNLIRVESHYYQLAPFCLSVSACFRGQFPGTNIWTRQLYSCPCTRSTCHVKLFLFGVFFFFFFLLDLNVLYNYKIIIIALDAFKHWWWWWFLFLDILLIRSFRELHFVVCMCMCVHAVHKAGHEGHKEEVLAVRRREHMFFFMS